MGEGNDSFEMMVISECRLGEGRPTVKDHHFNQMDQKLGSQNPLVNRGQVNKNKLPENNFGA